MPGLRALGLLYRVSCFPAWSARVILAIVTRTSKSLSLAVLVNTTTTFVSVGCGLTIGIPAEPQPTRRHTDRATVKSRSTLAEGAQHLRGRKCMTTFRCW